MIFTAGMDMTGCPKKLQTQSRMGNKHDHPALAMKEWHHVLSVQEAQRFFASVMLTSPNEYYWHNDHEDCRRIL